ncbi:hypothetical protein [Flavivirga jejuensis]|uniref:Uncharacterized protein n=1 Tax=Flavivirga jejuensis TaxID=870487 RepID=A0ABT8WHW2_9FLAO|nr:hypothetical protein [Flavivirga jejuensis]MDO5972682.1 hypothetical protein [Flavivirga jejuensis]
MKKLIKLSCLFLFVSLMTTSCSNDDDGAAEENFSDTIEYKEDVVDITSSEIEDYEGEEGYYNYDFTLSGESDSDVSYVFYVELFSKGTESFKTGTFKYISETSSESADFYYTYADLEVDDENLSVKAGDITVSGSGSNYSISGVLTLTNDEVLNISYSGEFTVVDGE